MTSPPAGPPAAPAAASLVQPLAGLARAPSESPALAWPGGAMSYGELRARVLHLARETVAGHPHGRPVPVICSSRVHTALGVLAALQAGRAALPLDPDRPDLDDCLACCRAEGPHDAHDAHRVALFVPTSGTTGTSRVAMLSPAALDAHTAASASVLPALGAGDCWLVCLPMTSIGALAALWRTLSAGACLALLESFDPADARRMMAAGASHVSVVPAMLPPLAEWRAPPPAGLRCLLSGGGPLSAAAAAPALAEHWPLWHGWGMTETASHVAVGPVDEHWREGIAGRPLPGVTVTAGQGGRLAVAGPVLMNGYARPDGLGDDGLQPDGSLLSNDLGEVLDDGRVLITGRADEVIVSGGVNVHPAAVERVLARCEGVEEVAVTGRPDARWGMRLVALYTGAATPAALEAWARAELPSASRPRAFVRVAALPRNAMGKLLRHQLGEIGLEA